MNGTVILGEYSTCVQGSCQRASGCFPGTYRRWSPVKTDTVTAIQVVAGTNSQPQFPMVWIEQVPSPSGSWVLSSPALSTFLRITALIILPTFKPSNHFSRQTKLPRLYLSQSHKSTCSRNLISSFRSTVFLGLTRKHTLLCRTPLNGGRAGIKN